MKPIVEATEEYESWLAEAIPLLSEDLIYKHDRMADDQFEFMRATFYRWMQLFPSYCAELNDAPEVLSVGDLHTDNFGTWRDIEARLVYGINDFDEAHPLPYTCDLVRLATSACIALNVEFEPTDEKAVAVPILAGYRAGLKCGGKPFVLAEDNVRLRDLLFENIKDFEKFWKKLEELPTETQPLPMPAVSALDEAMPLPNLSYRTAHRRAGLGSLGRRRWVRLIDLDRANAARETKELMASAVVWAAGGKSSLEHYYPEIISKAVRSPDPFLRLFENWVVRRLSPDYTRVELDQIDKSDLNIILYSMGWETANIHIGSGKDAVKKVRKDLKKREDNWLGKASQTMLEPTAQDFADWQKYWLTHDKLNKRPGQAFSKTSSSD